MSAPWWLSWDFSFLSLPSDQSQVTFTTCFYHSSFFLLRKHDFCYDVTYLHSFPFLNLKSSHWQAREPFNWSSRRARYLHWQLFLFLLHNSSHSLALYGSFHYPVDPSCRGLIYMTASHHYDTPCKPLASVYLPRTSYQDCWYCLISFGSLLTVDHRWGLADGPLASHWLGGRHWGLAIGFPIGPSP